MSNDSHSDRPDNRLDYLVSMIYRYRFLWILPAVAGLLLSSVYVFFVRPEVWSARQSLIVRDDMVGQSFKPGRFESLESMKSAQETILEIARKPVVIRNALKNLGPESKPAFSLFGGMSEDWPSETVIEDLQGQITLSAPNGAELGKTEVIVLNAKGTTRERASKFVSCLLEEIILKTNDIRSQRLASMVKELEQTRDAAFESLETSKSKLRQMDRILGGDTGNVGTFELGDETLQKDISVVRAEARKTESEIEQATKVLAMLVEARNNPQQIINISADLIGFQPALEDSKKELLKAQQAYAMAFGQYTQRHPIVQSRLDAIDAIKKQIYNELESSLPTLRHEIEALKQIKARLNSELEGLKSRLTRISDNRVDSLTLISEVKKRTEIANNAESDLQELGSLTKASRHVELITKVDTPQVSTRPDGLGKRTMIMAGGFAGLMLGLGLVMLVAPPMTEFQSQGQETANLIASVRRISELPEMLKTIVPTPSQSPETAEERLAVQHETESQPGFQKWPVTPEPEQQPVARESRLKALSAESDRDDQDHPGPTGDKRSVENEPAVPTETTELSKNPVVTSNPDENDANPTSDAVSQTSASREGSESTRKNRKQVTRKSYAKKQVDPDDTSAEKIQRGTEAVDPEEIEAPISQGSNNDLEGKEAIPEQDAGSMDSTDPVWPSGGASIPSQPMTTTSAARSPDTSPESRDVVFPGGEPISNSSTWTRIQGLRAQIQQLTASSQTEIPEEATEAIALLDSFTQEIEGQTELELKTMEEQAEALLKVLAESAALLAEVENELENPGNPQTTPMLTEEALDSVFEETVSSPATTPTIPRQTDQTIVLEDVMQGKSESEIQREVLARLMEDSLQGTERLESPTDSDLPNESHPRDVVIPPLENPFLKNRDFGGRSVAESES